MHIVMHSPGVQTGPWSVSGEKTPLLSHVKVKAPSGCEPAAHS